MLGQDDETYVNLVTEMRNAATSMRAARTANQVAVLFIDDQSMRTNRSGCMMTTQCKHCFPVFFLQTLLYFRHSLESRFEIVPIRIWEAFEYLYDCGSFARVRTQT